MNKKSNDKLKSVTVILEFAPSLQSIIGVTRTSVEVTEGTPFIMLLHAVLDSYPDLIQKFGIKALGFEVNGRVPNPQSLLGAHDVISIGLQHYDNDFDNGYDFYH
ncbi:MAG: hypothetical protein WBM02_07525 [bacterium]